MRIWPRRVVRLQLGIAALVGVMAAAFPIAGGAPLWAVPAGLAAASVYAAFGTRRYLRRRRLLREPFPPAWRELLRERVPFYAALEGAARDRFETDVRIFLREQTIYGPRNTPVPEDAKILVAASAAMLGHGLPDWEWPDLRDIIVYPGPFDEDYQVGRSSDYSGMVHRQGPILLSLPQLRHGFRRPRDGHNVALHELAHVMDMADGWTDGVLHTGFAATAPWIAVMADRIAAIRGGEGDALLRRYAGTDPAEFLAVAIEVFFERPDRMKARDPALYGLLREFLRQDPAA